MPNTNSENNSLDQQADSNNESVNGSGLITAGLAFSIIFCVIFFFLILIEVSTKKKKFTKKLILFLAVFSLCVWGIIDCSNKLNNLNTETPSTTSTETPSTTST